MLANIIGSYMQLEYQWGTTSLIKISKAVSQQLKIGELKKFSSYKNAILSVLFEPNDFCPFWFQYLLEEKKTIMDKNHYIKSTKSELMLNFGQLSNIIKYSLSTFKWITHAIILIFNSYLSVFLVLNLSLTIWTILTSDNWFINEVNNTKRMCDILKILVVASDRLQVELLLEGIENIRK